MAYIPKFKVKKGRTVTCLMGVAHEGGILTTANFSGTEEEKQKKIVALVEAKTLELIEPTEAEKLEIVEIAKALEEAEQLEATKADTKAQREAAINEADFDGMNKAPMIEFAELWEITLAGTTAEEIRAELIALQESLTAPE